MKLGTTSIVSFLLVSFSISGCVRVEITTKVNADGSGSRKVVIVSPVFMAGEEETNQYKKAFEKEFGEEWTKITYFKNNEYYMIASREFEKTNELNDEENTVHLSMNKERLEFSEMVKIDKTDEDNFTRIAALTLIDLTFKLEMPFQITKTNGILLNEKTVTWKLDYYCILSDNYYQMNASCDQISPSLENMVSVWIPPGENAYFEQNKYIREVCQVAFIVKGPNTVQTEMGRLKTDENQKRLASFQFYNNDSVIAYNVMNSMKGNGPEQHIRMLMDTYSKYDYDGIDIDYENFMDHDNFRTYKSFIRTLRKYMASDNILSISVQYDWAPQIIELINEGYVDELRLMAYDYCYAKEGPSPIAPINLVQESLNKIVKICDFPEKIILGIPCYHYDWTLNSKNPTSGSLKDALDKGVKIIDLDSGKLCSPIALSISAQENSGTTIQWDKIAKTPWFKYFNEEKEGEIHFENAHSISSKLALAQAKGIGGVCIWHYLSLKENLEILNKIEMFSQGQKIMESIPNKEDLMVNWELTGGEFINNSGQSSVTWIAPSFPGNYTIKATLGDGGGLSSSNDVTIQVKGSEFLLPQGLTYVSWTFAEASIKNIAIDVTIHNDLDSRIGLYFQMYQGSITGQTFYYGMQTNLFNKADNSWHGKGFIFSRWGTRELTNARKGKDAWFVSDEENGDFIGLRKKYDWKKGSYRFCIELEEEDQVGAWYAFSVNDLDANKLIYIGSLRFPKGNLQISNTGNSWVELYSGTYSTSDIPFWSVTIDAVRANNDKIPIRAVSKYGCITHIQKEWSDIYYDKKYNCIHFEIGHEVERKHESGQLF